MYREALSRSIGPEYSPKDLFLGKADISVSISCLVTGMKKKESLRSMFFK